MDIDAVKEYLRIDDDADDMTIELMMSAAKEYIKDSVGKCDETNPKTRMLFFALVQDFYENRILTVKEADKQRLSHVIGSMVLQLQMAELEAETDG